MTNLLGERIPQILEMRLSGLGNQAIAEALRIGISAVRGYEKSTKREIRRLVSHGGLGIKEVADRLNLSPITVDMFVAYHEIKIPKLSKSPLKQTYKTKKERVEAIRQALADGADSVDAVVEKVGVSRSMVRMYAADSEIKLPTIKETRAKAIRQAIAEGVESLEALCEEVNLQLPTVIKYSKDYDIKLPLSKRRPEIDKLIEQRLSVAEISRITELTPQAIYPYIRATKQYAEWKIKREEDKEAKKQEKQQKNQLLERLVSVLETRVYDLARKEGFAYQKAIEFKRSKKFIRYKLPSLVTLFERCEKAINEGTRLSLEKLCSGLDINHTSVGRVLNDVGMKPPYGTWSRYPIPGYKRNAIQRSFGLEMTAVDIAYFLDLSHRVVINHFLSIGTRSKIRNFIVQRGGKKLTYRLASQIYQAQNLWQSTNEIPELLDTNEAIVDYTIKHRPIIRPEIIGFLKVLYPDKNINRPYMTQQKRS